MFLDTFLSNMGRKFVVGGNWKMNGDKKQITEIVETLKKASLDPNVEVKYFNIICFYVHSVVAMFIFRIKIKCLAILL